MRVIDAVPETSMATRWHSANRRAANIELLALLACSVVIALGLALTYFGRMARLDIDSSDRSGIIDLRRLKSASDLEPVLSMFEQPFERQAVARALYIRAVSDSPPLEHVGGLAAVTIPATTIRRDRRFVELRSRLTRRPALVDVPVLTSSELASIKPGIIVRSRAAFRRQVAAMIACLVGAFWIAHLVRRLRSADDDPLILPIVMLLCGIGLMSMIALRDPLRDMLIGRGFVTGIIAGMALLLVISEVDFEGPRLGRAVLLPLTLAFVLAVLLLVFGRGPGASGAKVNLAGMQPVEAIRLLVVLGLAAYFGSRLDLIRELSEAPTPSRPWLQWIHMPRWKDIGPLVVSMALVLTFFFLQKDLGPALVMSCVFLALYGIARRRIGLVTVGFAVLIAGFTVAYAIGMPATVRQRVMIWLDPWNNGVTGGNQIAHGLWALSTGGPWGLGEGLGAPQLIPAGHTDFVLAVAGEELGFVGLAIIAILYVLVCWRALRIAARAPGDYTTFAATGVTLGLVVQVLIIAGGLFGLIPLSGVVTPFLSYGKSSMLANFAAAGILLAIAKRRGAVRPHFHHPIRVVGAVLTAAAFAIVARAAWVQIPRADAYATMASLGEQADGGYRFEYNPRLLSAARMIPRGTIYDRTGLPLATSRRDEIANLGAMYRKAGIDVSPDCSPDVSRCYPLGGIAYHVLGDWRYETNWGARNSSYVERDRATRLQGYDDRARVVETVNPRTKRHDTAVKRDYTELLTLARNRYRPAGAAIESLLARNRDLRTSIDAKLQRQVASALQQRIQAAGSRRGSAVVLDSASNEVLAAVSYPWPVADDVKGVAEGESDEETTDRLLDRVRYGLYPPGSTFKLIVAGAALRSNTDATYACIRLPDGRVGNYVRGARRPVRDDPLDKTPHGVLDLHHALVVSCNAYFAQLALRLGPGALIKASAPFQIDVARLPTTEGLEPTLAHAGYGQGEVLVSPLKMARVAAAIAAGGNVRPVRWEPGPAATDANAARFLSVSDAAILARYMRDVVTSGTGRSLQSNGVAIAGKTGTAEVANGASHSWFVGFAPFAGPGRRIAFAVLVENAGYGARTAAPIAGEIVSAARASGLIQ
jgi:cell division protein FtsW (lipid II flippase)/cell division protein FtsI/penicillin-binding protein 2